MSGPRPDDDAQVAALLRQIKARAEHPDGYRLYDYRPDVLALLEIVHAVQTEHAAVPASPGEPVTVCLCCRTPIEGCRTRLVLTEALRSLARNRPGSPPRARDGPARAADREPAHARRAR